MVARSKDVGWPVVGGSADGRGQRLRQREDDA